MTASAAASRLIWLITGSYAVSARTSAKPFSLASEQVTEHVRRFVAIDFATTARFPQTAQTISTRDASRA